MSNAAIDPENLFWRQIEEQPGDPLPRLVYADWCDENDRPVMAIVQRWLAAGGRAARPSEGGFVWLRRESALGRNLPRTAVLPDPLFDRVVAAHGARNEGWGLSVCRFDNRRASEEAVAEVWDDATRRRWFGGGWRPHFEPPDQPLSPEEAQARLAEEESQFQFGLHLRMFAILAVILFLMFLAGWYRFLHRRAAAEPAVTPFLARVVPHERTVD